MEVKYVSIVHLINKLILMKGLNWLNTTTGLFVRPVNLKLSVQKCTLFNKSISVKIPYNGNTVKYSRLSQRTPINNKLFLIVLPKYTLYVTIVVLLKIYTWYGSCNACVHCVFHVSHTSTIRMTKATYFSWCNQGKTISPFKSHHFFLIFFGGALGIAAIIRTCQVIKCFPYAGFHWIALRLIQSLSCYVMWQPKNSNCDKTRTKKYDNSKSQNVLKPKLEENSKTQVVTLL